MNREQEASRVERVNELERLLILAYGGDATEVELERLNSLLRAHKDLRLHAIQFLRDDALLRRELQVLYASELLAPDAASTSTLGVLTSPREKGQDVRGWFAGLSRPKRLSKFRLVHSLAAAVFVLGFVFSYAVYQNALRDTQQQELASDLTDNGVAVLTQMVAVEWEPGSSFTIGDTIPPGMFKLKSGQVQLEFYSGATMVLEGPAELELESSEKCFIHKGKMRVVVPEAAIGFRVLSRDMELIDLGTEFAVEVTPETETQVHVFDGKVKLYSPNRLTELLAGSGLRLPSSGDPLKIAANTDAFVSLAAMERLAKQEFRQLRSQWEQHTQNMQKDSRVAVFYPFQRPEGIDRTLQAHSPLESSRDGAIVGCSWSEGRWPGKDALEFKRPGDRVRIHVPGEYEAMTLAAWVRVDGLDRIFSSLMLTDGYDMGEIHWQIRCKEGYQGNLRVAIRNTEAFRDTHEYDSPAIWDIKQLGQWTHVATVVDNQAGYVAHYANGREISREPLVKTTRFRIGNAEIGNWRGPMLDSGKILEEVSTPIRNFNGRIDEFVIMDKALNAKEIEELYNAGKPGAAH